MRRKNNMNKQEAESMQKALSKVYEICQQEQTKPQRNRCVGCPANERERMGERLCPYGDMSPNAPFRWYKPDFERK